jgi:hypothetical protein
MNDCYVTTEYARRGIPVAQMRNERLHLEITRKSGDVTDIRDKWMDTNMLFESPHNWRGPGETAERPDPTFSFLVLSRSRGGVGARDVNSRRGVRPGNRERDGLDIPA